MLDKYVPMMTGVIVEHQVPQVHICLDSSVVELGAGTGIVAKLKLREDDRGLNDTGF